MQFKKFKETLREDFKSIFGENKVVTIKGQVQLRIEEFQLKPFLWTDMLIIDIEEKKAQLLHEEKLEADKKWIKRHGIDPDRQLEPFVQKNKRIEENAKMKLEELKQQFGIDKLREVLGV